MPAVKKEYLSPPVDEKEILRYAGVPHSRPGLLIILDEVLAEAMPKLTYRVVYTVVSVTVSGDTLTFPFGSFTDARLAEKYREVEEAVLFGATVGPAPDRFVARYSRSHLSHTKALFHSALGTERVEALCDAFEADIAAEYRKTGCETVPRVSPGYGGFPLETQKNIAALLELPKAIGVSLTEGGLMVPAKSVTALIGIKKGKTV